MSKKTHTWKHRAVGAKTGRDAAPILTQVNEPKINVKQTEVKSVLPLLKERITNAMFADTADWKTFVSTTKQSFAARELAEIA